MTLGETLRGAPARGCTYHKTKREEEASLSLKPSDKEIDMEQVQFPAAVLRLLTLNYLLHPLVMVPSERCSRPHSGGDAVMVTAAPIVVEGEAVTPVG